MEQNNVLGRLKKINDTIEKMKSDKTRLEGRLEQIMKQLKEKFNVNTIEEARKVLSELESDYKKLEKETSDIVDKLERTIFGCK